MRKFDEQVLKSDLDRLPPRSRVTFAACCAQRLADTYRSFLAQGRRNERAASCDAALDFAWTHILTSPDGKAVDRFLADIMALIPDQDAPGWTPLTAYAEDALSALAYCLQCLQSQDAQEAAWAARRVYESLDYFVATRDNISPDEPGAEARVLGDRVVQEELERQARDISVLDEAGEFMSQELLDRLRKQSIQEQAIRAN